MFQSQIANIVAEFNRQLCMHGARYALVYVDTVSAVTGQLGVRMSSNVEPPAIASLFGSLLEPGEEVKQMLSDLFKAHPLMLPVPVDPENPPAPDATPVLIEVPVEQAVEVTLSALLTNLRLKDAQKPSPIVLPGA